MDIHIREVKDRRDLKKFIYLPEKIHKNHEEWVHPIYMDEWKYFNPRKNKAFAYCDTIRLLAYRGEKPAGRIMGIINSRYNKLRQEKVARFCYLETWKEREVVQALLHHVEEWARRKGMTRIVGPYGFSDQDPEGFIIEGFKNRATIATYCNFDWMPRFVEDEGYTKDIDYFVYKIYVPEEFPEFYKKIYERVKKRGQFELLQFKKKKELKPWIRPVLRLMNECYTASNIYGYTPLSEKEMDDLAKRYLPVIDPRFVKAALKEGEIVGFVVGIPDMTEGIQKAKGRMLPFGVFKILRAVKRTKQLDILLGAVKEKYRGLGIDVFMGVSMLSAASEAGLEWLDTHHEMETNLKVRAEMEKVGGKVYKKFRVYQKKL